MQNRFVSKVGTRRQWNWSSPPGGQSTYSEFTVYPADAYVESLSVLNPGNNNGNRKDPNPISFSRTDRRKYYGAVWGQRPSGGGGYEGDSPHPLTLPTYSHTTNNLYNEALGRLYEQIRGTIDVSVDAAQAGQTARMVRKALQVASYIRSFHPKRWGEKWLEYQYGWKPTIQTVWNISKSTIDMSTRPIRIIASASETIPITYKEVWTYADQEYRYPIYERKSGFISRRVRFDTRWQIGQNRLQSIGNFTSLNPASIAWELLPYSFIVDWFYDVGGYLRNLETALLYGSSFRNGYVTYGSLANCQGSIVGDGYDRFTQLHNTWNLKAYYRTSWKQRDVLGAAPVPKRPELKVDLGSSRLLSAASLLSLHLKGRTR